MLSIKIAMVVNKQIHSFNNTVERLLLLGTHRAGVRYMGVETSDKIPIHVLFIF